MNWFSALILFVVIWFMVLFVVLPLRLRTQGDDGDVVPGTHIGAPSNFNPRRTAKIVTVVAILVWVVIAGIIVFSGISVRDLGWLNRLTILPVGGTGG